MIVYWTLKAHQADNACLSLEYSVPWSMHSPFHAVGQWHMSVSYFFFYPPTFINSHLKLLIEIVYHKGRLSELAKRPVYVRKNIMLIGNGSTQKTMMY